MSASSRVDQIQIGRVIGIPIYLHFSWLIIFGLIVWTLSTGYFPAQYPDLPASSSWAKGLVASLLILRLDPPPRAGARRRRPAPRAAHPVHHTLRQPGSVMKPLVYPHAGRQGDRRAALPIFREIMVRVYEEHA
jgi:hypothetical protein